MTNPSEGESRPKDSDLLRAYIKGDSRAFEQLLRRYEKPLFTFVSRMLGNNQDAEDVFQETLTRVIRNIRSYDEQGKFSKWMFGIAYNLSVDTLRKRKWIKVHFAEHQSSGETDRKIEFIDREPLPDALLEQKELKEMILQTLQRLPTEQREIFLLRQHSDMTFREIAELVHRPLNTVLSQMHLALLSIRKFLLTRTK